MDLIRVRRAMLRWKLATWSRDALVRRDASRRLAEVRQEINHGLRGHTWRGSFDSGGYRNRSQRKHTAKGGTLYRDGFHWLAYGRSLRTGGWLP